MSILQWNHEYIIWDENFLLLAYDYYSHVIISILIVISTSICG